MSMEFIAHEAVQFRARLHLGAVVVGGTLLLYRPVPLPATPTTWKYKAIYRVKDEQIGNWSDMVSIAVGG